MDKPNKRRMKRNTNAGFTLIEMMVTILILSILTAVAFPSFRSLVTGQRIKNASFDIMAMLTLARSEAITRNTQVTATPTSSSWADGWSVATSGGTVIGNQSAIAGGSVTITCFQGTVLTPVTCGAITYGPNGRITNSQQQSIQISSQAIVTGDGTGGGPRCITIDLSGRPNSKKGTC